MKWNVKIGALAAASLIGLSACSTTHSANQPIEKNNGTVKKEVVNGSPVRWHVFNQSFWTEKKNGLTIQIDKIAVTPAVPDIELANKSTPAIKLTYKIHNTSNKDKWDVHPTNGVLSTSNGKHLKSAMMLSKDQRGKISPGASRKVTVGYYLKGVKLNQLKWVDLEIEARKLFSNSDQIKDLSIDTGEIQIK